MLKSMRDIKWLVLGFIFLGAAQTAMCDEAGLPPVGEDGAHLSTRGMVFVSRFQLEGNTVFSDEMLAPILAPYENREITAEELQEVKSDLTRYYIANGYVNSGAMIPDQKLNNGVVVVRIIEGRLAGMTISGAGRLRIGYIRSRIERGVDFENEPLNVHELHKSLKLLKQDPRIENVNAELGPGLRPGEADLKIAVDEARAWRAGMAFNNYNSPSIGSYRGEIHVGHMNLTGWGDSLDLNYALTEGLNDYWLNYTIPVTRWDATITLEGKRSESTVVAALFKDLDIGSQTTTWSVNVRHPFIKTLTTELALGLMLEKNKNRVFLLDENFSYSGSHDGENKETVLRFTQQWVKRGNDQVFALFSSLNFGLDMLGATVLDYEPDGEFFSWVGQCQYVRKLKTLDSRILLRLNVQLSNDPLLPVEKMAIGGHSTVRGYRENQMTTDNGVVAGVEWRAPITTLKIPGISKETSDGKLEIAPFFDYGNGWNTDRPHPDPRGVYSVGVGLRWYAGKRLQVEIYWGRALEDVETSGAHDLQDDGISFQIRSEY
ncbi:MAG: ShlB/FhaC/HecB family hemolysin secretion/activation protein [Desulfobacterales bacterium]|nr:ShlB/FhaC/HecB family hemolysin secretion/activation protein [Desulfobacterales bacterium]